VRVITRQQWTPDLAEDIAHAESVIFIDCSVESSPGELRMHPVEPAAAGPGLASHHVGSPELLVLGQELYDSLPREAVLLTVGADSTELGETFSKSVHDALPEACRLIENTVRNLIAS
jgi:hydrogenase maturation protease